MTPAYVMVGSVLKSSGGTAYNVSKIITHPLYDANKIVNDIGMIKTLQTIVFNTMVQPITVPVLPIPDNSNLTLSGWGRTYVSLVKCIFIFGLLTYFRLNLDCRPFT